MTKIVLGAGLLLAATTVGAQVAPYAPTAPRDGVQTRAEVVERARTMFTRVDANRDGFITQVEGQAVRGQVRARVQQGRGARSADPARRAELFGRLDTNRDNMISRDEWDRHEARQGERRVNRQGGGQRGERLAMRGRVGGAMLRAADANRDQRISLAEAEAAALQRFDRVDLNRDGRVTQDERQQARRQWQGRRPAAAARN
jgi:hypothetical protein